MRACGPLVRSSYHADQQAHEAGVTDLHKLEMVIEE
jgi:hypothetical protein